MNWNRNQFSEEKDIIVHNCFNDTRSLTTSSFLYEYCSEPYAYKHHELVYYFKKNNTLLLIGMSLIQMCHITVSVTKPLKTLLRQNWNSKHILVWVHITSPESFFKFKKKKKQAEIQEMQSDKSTYQTRSLSTLNFLPSWHCSSVLLQLSGLVITSVEHNVCTCKMFCLPDQQIPSWHWLCFC